MPKKIDTAKGNSIYPKKPKEINVFLYCLATIFGE